MDIIKEYTLISDDNRKNVTHLHNQTIPIKRVGMEYFYLLSWVLRQSIFILFSGIFPLRGWVGRLKSAKKI